MIRFHVYRFRKEFSIRAGINHTIEEEFYNLKATLNNDQTT
jgi:hypothetical protein